MCERKTKMQEAFQTSSEIGGEVAENIGGVFMRRRGEIKTWKGWERYAGR